MKVDMPNEDEIRFEIDRIVTKGLGERESFYSYLKNMYRQIGIKHLFHDGLDLGFIILLISSILISLVKGSNIKYMENIELLYAYLFTTSPILYLAMAIYAFINVKQNKTYEVEMTCKYDLYQIAAFRMLVFSIICILFNFFIVFVATYYFDSLDFIKAFIISIASLFLFSSIFLFILTRFKNRLTRYFSIFGWLGANFFLYVFNVDYYIELVSNISIYTWLIVTVVSTFVYAKNLKKLTILRQREGMI